MPWRDRWSYENDLGDELRITYVRGKGWYVKLWHSGKRAWIEDPCPTYFSSYREARRELVASLQEARGQA